jgi:hypothetical protein
VTILIGLNYGDDEKNTIIHMLSSFYMGETENNQGLRIVLKK